MPIEISLRYQDPVLHVTASGEFALDSAKATLMTALEAAKKHEATGVLIDCRLVTVMGSDVDLFHYAKAVVDGLRELRLHSRLAYVFESGAFAGQTEFAETVALNRGVDVRVFDNLDQAREWLSG